MLLISLLVSSLNSPVYVSIPVTDPAVVDLFLGRLDAYLSVALRQNDWGFFAINTDLYRLRLRDQLPARAVALKFGPVKWRFFWARIGNGLYVASQPTVLEDLAAMHSGESTADAPATKNVGAKSAGEGRALAENLAHALVRIRPQNWQRVLATYHLGWAENNREACIQNLGPLSNVSRTVLGKPSNNGSHSDHIHQLAAKVYGSRFYCPDGGQYQIASDGKQVTCSVHGSKEAAHQRTSLAADSPLGRLLAQFSDLTTALTFLEDGLHAVLTLEREGRRD